MPDFRHRPKAIAGKFAMVAPQMGDGTWAYQTEEGETFRVSNEYFRQHAVVIDRNDDGSGIYAMASDEQPARRYVLDHGAELVHFDDGTTFPIKEFLYSFIRVDDEGKPICAFVQPFHVQYEILRENGNLLHKHDLEEMVEKSRENGFNPGAGMYDIVTSGLEGDDKSFMDRMQSAMAPVWPNPSLDLIEATGLPLNIFQEIKDAPEYTQEAFRVLFETLMEPYIGEFPIERVKRVHLPEEYDLEGMIGGVLDRIATNAPFEVPNIIRGYQTSEVAHFGNDHIEAIVFSDAGGKYAYIWPTQPKPEPGVRP